MIIPLSPSHPFRPLNEKQEKVKRKGNERTSCVGQKQHQLQEDQQKEEEEDNN